MVTGNKIVSCMLEDGIATVTITNPPMNALNDDAIVGLRDVFADLDKEPTVRCVILTGAGEKAFVAGADINQFPTWTPDIAEQYTEKGQKIFLNNIENFKTPVIAAINGHAVGGGLELALACDIRLASDKARMGLPEVSLGIAPGYGGSQRLCNTIPVGEAKKMLYTGALIKADKALAIGLVQGVYPLEELMPQAKELANAISANGPLAVSATKAAINYQRNLWIEKGLAFELAGQKRMFGTADCREGVQAFLEKRKPSFQGK